MTYFPFVHEFGSHRIEKTSGGAFRHKLRRGSGCVRPYFCPCGCVVYLAVYFHAVAGVVAAVKAELRKRLRDEEAYLHIAGSDVDRSRSQIHYILVAYDCEHKHVAVQFQIGPSSCVVRKIGRCRGLWKCKGALKVYIVQFHIMHTHPYLRIGAAEHERHTRHSMTEIHVHRRCLGHLAHIHGIQQVGTSVILIVRNASELRLRRARSVGYVGAECVEIDGRARPVYRRTVYPRRPASGHMHILHIRLASRIGIYYEFLNRRCGCGGRARSLRHSSPETDGIRLCYGSGNGLVLA